jgi:hypothetical protein
VQLWLGFELRRQLPKALSGNAFRLAILPLIQVAALPRFVEAKVGTVLESFYASL